MAQGLVARFTAAEDEILDLIDRRAAEAEALRKDLAQLESEWAESQAAALWSAAPVSGESGSWRPALDASADRIKKVAQALRTRPAVAACVATRGDRPQIVVTRSDDITLDSERGAPSHCGSRRRQGRGSSGLGPGRCALARRRSRLRAEAARSILPEALQGT